MIFNFIKRLFKSTPKNAEINVMKNKEDIKATPRSPRIMLSYGTDNVMIQIRYRKYDSIEVFQTEASKFCREFREGRGYEYINECVKNIKLDPSLSEEELKIVVNSLREWGHQHQDEA